MIAHLSDREALGRDLAGDEIVRIGERLERLPDEVVGVAAEHPAQASVGPAHATRPPVSSAIPVGA